MRRVWKMRQCVTARHLIFRASGASTEGKLSNCRSGCVASMALVEGLLWDLLAPIKLEVTVHTHHGEAFSPFISSCLIVNC